MALLLAIGTITFTACNDYGSIEEEINLDGNYGGENPIDPPDSVSTWEEYSYPGTTVVDR